MKKIDFKSMKFKFFKYFAIFSFGIIGLFLLFQWLFYEFFYSSMQEKSVIKYGEELFKTLGEESFEDSFDTIVFNNHFIVSVIRKNEELEVGYEIIYDSGNRVEGNSNLTNIDVYSAFIEKLNAIDYEKVISYKTNLTSDGTEVNSNFERLIVGGKRATETDELYFFMSSAVVAKNSTTEVLQTQIFITSVLIIVIGICVSLVVAKKLSKPIMGISDKAERISQKDFSVRFDEHAYTEVSQLSNVLNKSCEELEKAETLQKYLLANVSHDLKTPLTMIKGYAEMAQELPLSKESLNNKMQIIIDESDRLTKLINDILNMSKIESGSEHYEMKTSSISTKCHDLDKTFKEYCKMHKIELKSNIEDDLNVVCDDGKLTQVLYNFLANAINYSKEHSVIELKLFKKGEFAVVEVVDFGVGISDKDIEYIWDKYYKSQISDKVSLSSGLGLYICKKILQEHNAEFGVKSEIDNGATFWFKIKTV